MRIETVVEGERASLARHRIDDRRHRAVHLDNTLAVYGRVLRLRTSGLQ